MGFSGFLCVQTIKWFIHWSSQSSFLGWGWCLPICSNIFCGLKVKAKLQSASSTFSFWSPATFLAFAASCPSRKWHKLQHHQLMWWTCQRQSLKHPLSRWHPFPVQANSDSLPGPDRRPTLRAPVNGWDWSDYCRERLWVTFPSHEPLGCVNKRL